jgi:hypothetical protein
MSFGGATTTSSVVNCNVCFEAEAKFAPMAAMRRKAAVHVAAEVGPVWVDSVEKVRHAAKQVPTIESHFEARTFPEPGFTTGVLAERYSTQTSQRDQSRTFSTLSVKADEVDGSRSRHHSATVGLLSGNPS